MKKVIMTLIILMCVFQLSATVYKPLTMEQADNYLDSVKYEVVRDLVIKYDVLEHTIPQLTIPHIEYLLIDNDLVITPVTNILIKHGTFSWSVPMKQDIIYSFTEPPKSGIPILALITSVASALAIGFIIGVGL